MTHLSFLVFRQRRRERRVVLVQKLYSCRTIILSQDPSSFPFPYFLPCQTFCFSLSKQNTLTDFASVRSQQDLRGRLASLSFSESGVGRKGLPKGTPRAAGGESKAEGGGQAAGMQACSGSPGTTHAGEQRRSKERAYSAFSVSTLAT